jgi:hypothetical protein
MSLTVNITGLQKLQRELEEAQRGCQSLNGTIATLKFEDETRGIPNAARVQKFPGRSESLGSEAERANQPPRRISHGGLHN